MCNTYCHLLQSSAVKHVLVIYVCMNEIVSIVKVLSATSTLGDENKRGEEGQKYKEGPLACT